MPRYYIGTSGWQYGHWQNVFYPKNLPKSKWLEFYAENFNTVELNVSFYRTIPEKNYEDWRKKVPKNFIFSLKLSQYFTHRRKLNIDKNSLKFLKRTAKAWRGLGNNLGPVLIQLPPNMNCNPKRLKNFLKNILKISQEIHKKKLLFAIEFRNKTWLNSGIYEILRKYRIAFCISFRVVIEINKCFLRIQSFYFFNPTF